MQRLPRSALAAIGTIAATLGCNVGVPEAADGGASWSRETNDASAPVGADGGRGGSATKTRDGGSSRDASPRGDARPADDAASTIDSGAFPADAGTVTD